MNRTSSALSSVARFPLALLAIFAFWFAARFLVFLALPVDVRAAVWSRDWFIESLRFVVPFSTGTAVIWYAVPRLLGRRPFAFWEGCVLLVFAVSTVHVLTGALLWPKRGAVWSQIPVTTLIVMVQYTGIVGFVLALYHRREVETRRRESLAAQLRALRAQLQPHFLFNTLQAIGTTARHDGPTAARMTTLLGDMLRHTLRERGTELITLAEEHQQLTPYLQLQQLRFTDRLKFEVELPPTVLGAKVPDLLLQPLVENALEHGISQRPGAGTVRIRARHEADVLVLEVLDDGVGPETSDRAIVSGTGTGLGATNARLHALYGNRASVQLAKNHLGGTTATVRLPFSEAAARAA